MLSLPNDTQIFLGVAPIDMSKSFDGICAAIIEIIQGDPLSGHVILFRGKGGDKLKALIWDRNGFIIWYKRLEKGRFMWPRVAADSLEISSQELSLLLDGIDFTKLKRLPTVTAQIAL